MKAALCLIAASLLLGACLRAPDPPQIDLAAMALPVEVRIETCDRIEATWIGLKRSAMRCTTIAMLVQ